VRAALRLVAGLYGAIEWIASGAAKRVAEIMFPQAARMLGALSEKMD